MGISIFKASDLDWIILKFDKLQHHCISTNKSDIERWGEHIIYIKNIKALAKADKIWVVAAACRPTIDEWGLIVQRNGSRLRVKIKADKRQPCLVPLQMGKEAEVTLFTLTDAKGLEYSTAIQAIIPSPRPICLRVANRRGQLTLSKASSALVKSRNIGMEWCGHSV